MVAPAIPSFSESPRAAENCPVDVCSAGFASMWPMDVPKSARLAAVIAIPEITHHFLAFDDALAGTGCGSVMDSVGATAGARSGIIADEDEDGKVKLFVPVLIARVLTGGSASKADCAQAGTAVIATATNVSRETSLSRALDETYKDLSV